MTAPLMTAREVAGVLGVSTETILRWTRRGDLQAIRLPGGAIRYREADLEEWLAGHATGAVSRGPITRGPSPQALRTNESAP